MNRRTLRLAGTAAAAALAVFALSPAPALAENGRAGALFTSVAAAALVALGVAPFTVGVARPTRSRWLALGIVSLTVAVAAFVSEGFAQRTCTTSYDGAPTIIGTELTPTAAAYARDNPELTPSDLLFDAAGAVERVWTTASIGRCKLIVSATHALWAPFVLLALLGFVESSAASIALPVPAPATPRPRGETAAAAATRYDAFMSYRHGGPDTDVARQLLDALESRGYRVAIDERDFPANESFLQEMERCIRQSRFTIAIVSRRYLESGNCEEEAIICKVLDMGERRRRLIPITIEPVDMPAWLYGIVGIDVTKPDPLVDPLHKLVATLGPPQSRG